MFKPFSFCLLTALLLISLVANAQKASFSDYRAKLLKERADKDEEFLSHEGSPITDEDRETFRGLAYFKPAKKWIIDARLERFSNPDTIRMQTTTARLPLYIVFGKAHFEYKGRKFSPTVFQNVDLMKKSGYENYLFLPFTDLTSGEESYGGGRYLDLRCDHTQTVTLDFNRAYNPYCVYNKKYSCPVPPSENFLNIEVKAGEMNFSH